MRLVIPVFSEGKVYTEAEIREPNGDTLATALRLYQSGATYDALRAFIAGSLESLGDQKGAPALKTLVKAMSIQTANQVSVEISKVLKDGDDAISGAYECSECHEMNATVFKDEIDTRDHLSALPVIYMPEPYGNEVRVDFDEAIVIYSQGNDQEPLSSTKSMTFRWPTLGDCMAASARAPKTDDLTLQSMIFVESLIGRDGIPVDAQWRNLYGLLTMKRLKASQIRQIKEKLQAYRIETEVEKSCHHCGQEFKARLNTAGFFASALRV